MDDEAVGVLLGDMGLFREVIALGSASTNVRDSGLLRVGLEDFLVDLPLGIVMFDLDNRVIYRNQAAGLLLAGGDGADGTAGGDGACDAGNLNDAVAMLEAGDDMVPSRDWAGVVSEALKGEGQRLDYVTYALPGGVRRLVNVWIAPLRGDGGREVIGGAIAIEDTGVAYGGSGSAGGGRNSPEFGGEGLAARVAHELNNPLDGLCRYISLAKRVADAGDGVAAVQYLDEAGRGAERMVQIVRELLGHARAGCGDSDPQGVNLIVEEAVRSVQDRAGDRGVAIVATYRDDGMPQVRGTRLFQVCSNLLRNAIDAMPNGGMLTIQTGIVEGWVVLRFEDEGMGLPEDIERVFEPFYTTKAEGDGTGLGLAICRDYVRRFGGTLMASRGLNGGSVFTVRFPADEVACSGGGVCSGDESSSGGVVS